MHFDDSAESVADSGPEDGELQKMLTAPLYAQKASGKPDALVVQEREVSAQSTQAGKESLRFHSSEGQKALALVKPTHCFHLSKETWSGVLCSETNPSNLRGSLLEGNKDHLLNQARSDLAKQELHVESVNKCIGELQRQTEEPRLALQDVQNEFVESRLEQTRLQEEWLRKENTLRDTQSRSMHELGKDEKSASTTSWWVLDAKIKRKSRDDSAAHFLIAANARTDEFYEQFSRIPGYWNKITVEDCLTFPVRMWWFRVLVLYSAATKDCLLTHGIRLDYRKTFLVINFLRLIHPQITLKEIQSDNVQKTEEQSLEQKGRRPVTQVKTDKIKAQFQCRHLRQGRWPRVLQHRWNYRRVTWSDSKDSKYRNCKRQSP